MRLGNYFGPIVQRPASADICPLRNCIVLFCRWWLVLMVSLGLFENGLLRYVSKRGGMGRGRRCPQDFANYVWNRSPICSHKPLFLWLLWFAWKPQVCQGCWIVPYYRLWSWEANLFQSFFVSTYFDCESYWNSAFKTWFHAIVKCGLLKYVPFQNNL